MPCSTRHVFAVHEIPKAPQVSQLCKQVPGIKALRAKQVNHPHVHVCVCVCERDLVCSFTLHFIGKKANTANSS